MPSESLIRKKAIKKLEEEGWVCWYPAKVRFFENDIFGCYDIICVKNSKLRFIQLTSLSNIRAREKKVRKFLEGHRVKIPSEVWGWSSKSKTFKIIKL